MPILAVDRPRTCLARHYPGRVIRASRNFGELDAALDAVGVRKVDGILYDLGLSSMQLAQSGARLFLCGDEPLDMRLDPLIRCAHRCGPALDAYRRRTRELIRENTETSASRELDRPLDRAPSSAHPKLAHERSRGRVVRALPPSGVNTSASIPRRGRFRRCASQSTRTT